MSVRADILEIARVLSDASGAMDLKAYRAPSPLGEDARVYAALMPALPGNPDVPGALRGASFRPLFLVNGLIHAAAFPRMPRRLMLEALSAGLLEFAEYFEALSREAVLPPQEAAALQRRYFAYALAQLVECGFSMTAALTTIKGDALDRTASAEVRSWLEDGPKAMLASELLTEKERELWAAVFADGKGAWPALRDHLVAEHALPFRAAPAR